MLTHEARLNQPWVGLRAKAAKQTKTSGDSCLVSWASGLLLAIVDGKNPAPFKTYIANKKHGIQLLPVICCWPDFSHLK